jgi:hypothetical protein
MVLLTAARRRRGALAAGSLEEHHSDAETWNFLKWYVFSHLS